MKKTGKNITLKLIWTVGVVVFVFVLIGGGSLLTSWEQFSPFVAPSPIALPLTPTSEPTLIPQPISMPLLSNSGVEEDMQALEFNISTANTIIPDDVLEEVIYYGGMGGGGSLCYQLMLRTKRRKPGKICG